MYLMTAILNIADETWTVAGQMAPYLLFGFFAAGLLSAFVSPEWLERHLGGPGFLPVFKSVMLGVPLPLCSCGVIAVTASLRQHGASRAAATGFLIATPQTGVDSIAATWGMLGPVLGIFRPVVALLSGLFGGLLVSLFGEPETPGGVRTASGDACTTGGACGMEDKPGEGFWVRVRHVFHYGFVTLPRDIARPLVVGMILAGMISALVPTDALAPYIGGGVFAMLVMIAIGIPLYVCATASIPLAVGFIHMGASPGAALAFLIAGPATNAATIATVWNTMGRRTTLLYVASVAISALAAGLFYDALVPVIGHSGFAMATHHHHEHETGGSNGAFTLLLLAVVVYSVLELKILGLVKGMRPAPLVVDIPHITLSVKGMTCSHCAARVRKELEQAAGAGNVEVDLAGGRATIIGSGLDGEALRKVVTGLGYNVCILS
jgi:uncharacterized membrane protein YraQ (UPF0718 family)/copper chaperone CopZ